jgi:lipid II:glycine glycyltransferase (peptidoglycan interpeptide bridge formation enzyme)
MIQWLKDHGIQFYDLGAFNPQLNPGVYQFKKGLAGKKESEEIFLSEYDGCFNLRGRIGKIVTVRQKCRVQVEAIKHCFVRKALGS